MLGTLVQIPLRMAGLSSQSAKDSERARLEQELAEAENYTEWCKIAIQLDEVIGNNEWKMQKESRYYNWALVENRLKRISEVQASSNIHTMTRVLRSELFRKLGGMLNYRLHTHCNIGTKHLIEEYVDSVCSALEYICDTDWGTDFSIQEKFEFFFETRQAFGRSALLLSGGATLGMYHLGVVKVLAENQLLPRVISGSSVGSIIASVVAVRTDEELLKDIKKLEMSIRENLGDITFKEAYERTKRILNITVASTNEYEMPRLLNYLTTPNVLIWSAAAASCALTFLFEPVSLMAKAPDGKIVPYNPSGLKWADGSMETDLPMQRLSELFNINHFIVSQVNPHVLPFMKLHEDFKDRKLGKLIDLIGDEFRHRVMQLSSLGYFQGIAAVINQKYSGDVTIIPDFSLEDYTRLLSNPDKAWMQHCLNKSERKTWTKLTHIRNSCAVELTLDRCMKKVEVQLKRTAKAKGGAKESNPYAFMYKKVYK